MMARWLVFSLVVTGLAAAQPGRVPARRDFSFVHCSDIHVPPGVTRLTGPEGGPQFGSAEVVAQIKSLTGPVRMDPYGIEAPPPSFAIATGDLTEFGGGSPLVGGWWDDYLRLWEGAAFPVFHQSGNHDATWDCQRINIRRLYGRAYYSFDRGGCRFIAFDSATPQDPRPSFGEEELRWLERDLKGLSPETPVFLFCHHPIDSNELASLYERDRLLDLLRPYNLTLFLVGHGHAVQHRVIAGVDQVMGGSTFGPNTGYSLVDLRGNTLRVAYRRPWEPTAARAVLEKQIKPRADYPRIRFDSPGERQTVSTAILPLQVRIDRAGVTAAEWQADDVAERKGALQSSGSDWTARVDTTGWEPGAHYLRVVFHTPEGDFQRTVAFYTGGGEARPLWRARLEGSSKSTATVAGETVYVGASDGCLYALNRRTGSRRWRFETGGEVLANPLARDGTVYFGSGDGHFYAVDGRGQRRWRFAAAGPVYSSAIWANGMVLFGANDARFYALDARTGDLRWVSEEPDYTIEARPVVSGDTVYFGAWDSTFYALNLADGSLKWKAMCAGSTANVPGVQRYYSPADAPPVVVGGTVYVADRAYMLTILDAATGAVLGSRKNVSAVGVAEDGQAVYLRGTDGKLTKMDLQGQDLWSMPAYTSVVPTSPREVGGVVYSAGPTGRIVALAAADGRRLWEYQATPRLYVFSDVAAVGGVAWVSGMDGTVTALALREAEGKDARKVDPLRGYPPVPVAGPARAPR